MASPTRYAIVGLGGRHEMYRDAILTEFARNCTLVALCDTNPARVELSVQRAADQLSGAWSILTGIAANHSMAENRPVRIDELVSEIGAPEYPAMLSNDESPG